MEPALSHPYSTTQSGAVNPYANRWRWWYAAIADWMLENPGGGMAECARSIGRSYAAVCAIAATDLFKAHLALRRKEFEARRDQKMIEKVQKVANRSLDLMFDVLEAKRDRIPLQQLQSIAEGALDRLGYGPKPAAGLTVNNTVVTTMSRPAVSMEELEAARQSYRAIQEKNRTIEHQPGAGRLAAPRLDGMSAEAGLTGTRPDAVFNPELALKKPPEGCTTPPNNAAEERLGYDPLTLSDS